MGMKGLSARGLYLWMASAQTSLPVPDSPVMNTAALLGRGAADLSVQDLHDG